MSTELDLQNLEYKEPAPAPEDVNPADKLEQELEKDVPEKYRGKSVKDVIKMHQDAEVLITRQGQQLSDYRKVFDSEVLELGNKKTKEPEKAPITTEEILEDPNKAVNRAVEDNPTVQKAVSVAEQLERRMALDEFKKDFPDYEQDITNPEFAEWVKKSRVRVALVTAADNYDMDAARGLWEMWKEHREAADVKAEQARKKQESDNARKKQEADATLEGGVVSDGSSETVYDRKKLQELRIRALRGDYKAQQMLKKVDVVKVYSEKRVK